MLVLLDRDGVINFDSPHYIKSVEEWIPIPGALEAIAELTQANIQTAVITNQSGIARGLYDVAALESMHTKMRTLLAALGGRIDAIYFCPHHPDAYCLCRKPQPGLLQKAADDFQVELSSVPFIGDRLSDVAAANACGAIPYFISEEQTDVTTNVFPSLALAVRHILKS